MHNHSSFQRTPTSPQARHQLHGHPSRKPSIVELLSSPPPIPQTFDDDINAFSLSRNTSVSSKALSASVAPSDWSDILLLELTEQNKLVSIDSTYSIQQAYETLAACNLTSLPVSRTNDALELSNCLTFDYSDLNTYLLLMMNKINLAELPLQEIGDPTMTPQQKHDLLVNTINKGKQGQHVPVDFIIKLHPKNPFLQFSGNEPLLRAMEVFGNGVHRVAITDATTGRIIGILSQRRLIKYMWENARRFPSLDPYLNATLADLKIGTTTPITIYEDQPLIEALQKMYTQRVSSLAVIDRNKLLIGNISIVDVKNVSLTKNSHLLFKSVLNFISYNLSQKGIEHGQDQFPIFHVSPSSTLGRVIAKLVATKSHRLWVVESRHSLPHNDPSTVEAALKPQNTSSLDFDDNSGRPGKLIGVVTLTDILGLFAQSKTEKKIDPQQARNQRRRSSTTSTTGSIASAASLQSPPSPQVSNQELFRKQYTSKGDAVFSKD